MIRDLIQASVSEAIARLQSSGVLTADVRVPVEIVDPKDPSHGDFATSWALAAAKPAGRNPRELAETIKQALEAPSLVSGGEKGEAPLFSSIEIAGPGFLNFRVTDSAWREGVDWANVRADELARPQIQTPNPQRLNVEFVSVNPNGPITVGSGRGAAFGSTLCNVLEATGHQVHREYYINDGTNSEQMRAFAESVRAICLGQSVPDSGYKGDYVAAVAQQLVEKHTKETVLEEAGRSGRLAWFQHESEDAMLEAQRLDLGSFGLLYDTWFSEQSLHDSGKVAEAIQHLIDNHAADERPERRKLKLAKGGVIEDVEIEEQPVEDEEETASENSAQPSIGSTLWLRSTKFGDDMDRVLRRKDGRLTYISSDVAYHQDKFARGSKPDPNGKCERADKLITILGPDHHGYIGRLHAVLAASELGEDQTYRSVGSYRAFENLYDSEAERDACQAALAKARNELEVLIFQIVRFVKDGKPAPMRKRDGNIYSLRDLMAEIGKDAAPHASQDEQMRIGKDVARFFYLMRSHDTHMDFDIDLATKGTDENPVFYVQYAHARICSILEKADLHPLPPLPSGKEGGREALHPKEALLIKKILDLPEEVRRCAEDYGVHRLTTYAVELARTFHHFYDACRVLQPENPALQAQRLAICEATRHALRGVLKLLGISAPEQMQRELKEDPSLAER